MKQDDLYSRLLREEKRYTPKHTTPGTQVTRALGPDGAIWSVGFGSLMRPLRYWYGNTIDEALGNAERDRP